MGKGEREWIRGVAEEERKKGQECGREKEERKGKRGEVSLPQPMGPALAKDGTATIHRKNCKDLLYVQS